MPRSYQHIQEHEKEIIEMWNQGKSLREIGEKLGYTYEQMQNFKTRYNRKKRMLESGKAAHKRGRPSKDRGELPPSIQKMDKLAQMRYVMAKQERYIKRLEMENDLLRDFLSATERK